MNYFYLKPRFIEGDMMTVIRANFTSTSLLSDIENYALLRGAIAYGGQESDWDTAVAFELCSCIEFDGKEFNTIHKPG